MAAHVHAGEARAEACARRAQRQRVSGAGRRPPAARRRLDLRERHALHAEPHLLVKAEYAAFLTSFVLPHPELRALVVLGRLGQEIVWDKDIVEELERHFDPFFVCPSNRTHCNFSNKRFEDNKAENDAMVGPAVGWVNDGILHGFKFLDADA